MKKSRQVRLVLITAALASCHRPGNNWTNGNDHAYIRSDTTAPYSRVYHPGGAFLWYYAFRPYGNIYNGSYRRVGYYSSAISEESNIGANFVKTSIVRGGFGSGWSVSS